MRIKRRDTSPLRKKARRGFRGYPVASVAFYGPDDAHASKAVVGILRSEDATADPLKRWFSDESDVRRDPAAQSEILAFIQEQGVKSIVMPDRIIGCPHEEGIDYPDGEVCPQCPFCAHRDRWTGEIVQ